VADLPRRKFLKTIGTVALATAVPDVMLGSSAPQKKPSVAVFWQPGFPSIDACNISQDTLQQSLTNFAVSFLSEQDLIAQLNTTHFDLLITPYGSAFPKRSWQTLLKYLRAGGNWLNLGGVPLSRPVVRAEAQWRVESHQTTYHKLLGITHSFPIKTAPISTYEAHPDLKNGFKARQIYELYVRLSSSNNEPVEAGSDGPHEGVVHPLVLGMNRDRRAIAAPVIQIDRLLADFAGGRWVFANFSGSLDTKALRVLAETAAQGASRFEVRSDFACYQQGEVPSVSVKLVRPKGNLEKLATKNCVVEVRDNSGRIVSTLSLTLNIENTLAAGSAKLPGAPQLGPGLYKLHAQTNLNSIELTHTSGFWIYDEALIARGKPLTVDKHFFYRDGQVFPVTGTTYMASDVHRRFLLDPNPLVWDNDFRDMKAAGVNMVRTGIWTGWKKYMTDAGKLNEAALRAFDAFLLTAHKYDIPVIFTFFAFLPETWGGENAYLDPRSVKAQQQFIAAFTERCRRVDDVMWDFINEPSFGSYKHIWSCRPNYDAHEQAAWRQWLRDGYPAASDEEHASHLQQLWRTTGDGSLDLPALKDFESVHLIDDRLPLKTLDYRLFAQEMFIRWVRQMTIASEATAMQNNWLRWARTKMD
jgi:Cellulase (glycosyl hydrolase family 5)